MRKEDRMERKPIQRARCPCFRDRADFRAKFYIHCRGCSLRYVTSDARESQYRTRCCGDYETCAIYQVLVQTGIWPDGRNKK